MKKFKLQISIQHLWSLTAIVGIIIFVNTHPIRPHDFWWHIAIGREILSTGEIPDRDVYTYTMPGQAYPSYQMFWLMEIVLYTIYNLGGAALVVFSQSLMITGAYAVVLWLCWRCTQSWRMAAFGLLFAAALGLNDWNVRPQAVTFLLGALFLLAIARFRDTRKRAWLAIFPLGMVVWVNSHGTFPLGLALIGLWLGDEVWKVLFTSMRTRSKFNLRGLRVPFTILVLSSLACLVNPQGLGIMSYIKILTGNPVVQNLVVEWAPPTLGTLGGAIFIAGFLLAAAILILSPCRPDFFEFATFFGFALLALKTSRGIIWFGITVAPILARHLASLADTLIPHKETDRRGAAGSPVLNTVFVIVILLLGLVSLPWFKSALPLPEMKAGLISAETPLEATQVLLDERPPGQLFHAMSFGSYLIWAAQPDYPVFVDSRIELFSTEVWLDYLAISNAQGDWEQKLIDYGVNSLMLSPTEQQGLVLAARESNQWRVIYQDATAVIFTRSEMP